MRKKYYFIGIGLLGTGIIGLILLGLDTFTYWNTTKKRYYIEDVAD